MRILFISAFYPPYVVGGWEQLVQDINGRLQARGHITHVLTSRHGVDAPVHEDEVSRLLHLDSNIYSYRPRLFLNHRQEVEENLQFTREIIENFQPDIVFVHVMWNLSHGIAWMAEQLLPGRVVYYVANDWPHAPDPHTAYWCSPANSALMTLGKKMLAPFAMRVVAAEKARFNLKFEHVMCVSEAVKADLAQNAGIGAEAMTVVYNGVETDRFVPGNGRSSQPKLSLIYAGSLNWHKGVHTTIEAMALLAQSRQLGDMRLTLVGSGHPSYEAHLRDLVTKEDLADSVIFYGRVPREEMPALLQQFNVLLFPSTWEEPLSRMMQEGMAAGLTVVGTLTGGSGELLVEGETGLTFPPGNATVLAERLLELQNGPDLMARLAQNGREAVLARFDIRRMIDEIETYLQRLTV